MAVVSLGFDIIETIKGEVAAVFRSERLPMEKLALVRHGRNFGGRALTAIHLVSRKAYDAVVRYVADMAIEQIENKAAALGKHVVFFEGAKDILIQEMALTACTPDSDLISPLEKLQQCNLETLEQLRTSIDQLRSYNEASRVAAALEKLEHVVSRLDSSVSAILDITRDGTAHEDVLAQISAINATFDEKLAQYEEDVEFDPELVALADAAIERIAANAKPVSNHR